MSDRRSTAGRLLPAVMIFLVALSARCDAQSYRLPSLSDVQDDLKSTTRTAVTVPQAAPLAYESVVDPDHYFVGPSDQISVNVWTVPPLVQVLTVSPEGTLIIPTVGEVRVADLTLTQAKEKILAEVRRKYISGQATVTLVRPRSVVVMVTGSVISPGLYTVTAVDRAHRAIEEANKYATKEPPPDYYYKLDRMSTRNVYVKHKDGTHSRVDIDKFLVTRDGQWNPFLREGDVVVVPRKSEIKNMVGVYGEVNSPGRYEFVEGDSIKDLLMIGQGFTRQAKTDTAEFTRMDATGRSMKIRKIPIDEILKGRQQDTALQPGDRIVVAGLDEQRADYRVHIKGEILYPGIYPISRDKTCLSEIIRRAGGFTQYASLKTAEVTRRSVDPNAIQLEQLESLRGGASMEDSSYYILETNLRIQREIVNVDFEKLFFAHDSTQDIVLNTEDVIYVPPKNWTIYVFGQVASPGHVPFTADKDVQYYIDKAGGFTERAREGDVKIIKTRTRQWLSPGETIVEEGDYVWVPKVSERPFGYYLNVIGQTAAILSVALSLYIVAIKK